jgi:hypothetical protein
MPQVSPGTLRPKSSWRTKLSHFGADFDDFSKQCGGRRRNYFVYKAPSILDPIWNPANVYQRFVEGGIRTQQAASLPESPPW